MEQNKALLERIRLFVLDLDGTIYLGRDELEIADKARLDGYYVEHLSFGMDVKCFFGTIVAVLDHDGVVEGGTGAMNQTKEEKSSK